MKPSDFIHPEDAAVLRQMENIPEFKGFYQILYRMWHAQSQKGKILQISFNSKL